MSAPVRGQFLGRAGRGLDDASWAANAAVAKIGQDAEVLTGRALLEFTALGPSVINDLRIPIPGFTANIDHVVVSGNRVLIIDSKAWAGGFYWTAGGRTRRGGTLFPEADKKTLPTAVAALERYFRSQGVGEVHFERPLLAVWPRQSANFLLYRPQGNARVTHGSRLPTWLRAHVPPAGARGDILIALARLANEM